MYGIPGYDHLLPDESEAGEQAWRAEVGRFLEEAGAITAATPAEAVTLDCVREAGAHEQDGIDMALAEHTVTAMQFAGPATFLAVAARTVLVDPEAAEAYLARLRSSGTWFGQLGERLRTGAGKGRLPVAPLAERAIAWAQDVLPGLGPVFTPQPPPGWPRAAAWEQERRAVADEVVRPALAGWVETVRELLPRARPSDRAGWSGCRAGRRTTPGPSGSSPPCPALRRSCIRPASIRSPSWRPGPCGWAPGSGCPGGTRCSARCATRRARSLPKRPSARRSPRCGGPRRGPASCSRSRCRHRVRSRRCRRSSR
jgi:hypothetical protein